MLRLVTTGLVVLAAVGLVAEVAAPRFVEARVEATVREHTDAAAAVRADAGSFPFVPGLLLDGMADHLTVTLDEVAGERVTLGTVALTLEGIHVSRRAMLRGDVEITGIDRGEVLVDIDQRRLAEDLDAPVELAPEAVALAGDALRIALEHAPDVEVPVDTDLLPCEPRVQQEADRLLLSCEFDRVPDVLVRIAQP